jgi:adenylate cyclase
MKSRYLILFFLSSILGLLQAQKRLDRVDSIYRFSLTHQEDSAALEALNNALIDIYSDNSDTAIYYAKKQVDISKERGWDYFEAVGLLMIGVSMEFSGNLDSAISYYQRAGHLGQQTRDSTIQLAAHNSLGRVYSIKGMYQLSIEETLNAVDLVANGKDTSRTASLLNSVGLRFMELNRTELAVGFLRRALRLNQNLVDTIGQVRNCGNLGKAYNLLENLDSSYYFYLRAKELSHLIANRYQHMLAHAGLSQVYIERGELDSARRAIDTAEAIAHEVRDLTTIHETDYLRGLIYLKEGRSREAITYLEDALEWFDSGNYKAIEIEILQALSAAYQATSDYERSLVYLQRLNNLKDDVYLKQRDMAMAQVEFYRQEQQEKETELLNNKIELSDQELEYQTGLRNIFFLVGLLFLGLLAVIANRYLFERKTKKLLAQKNALIEFEKERSENLLLNILPADVAHELKEKGRSDARHFDHVSVLFSDFVGFTDLSARLTPARLVQEIDECFKAFDEIMTRYDLEKIKTIGDAYMAVGGLTDDDETHAAEVVKAGLEMQDFIEKRHQVKNEKGEPAFQMRVGIHTGPVVAGIVGVKKFQYDIWGDTVNTASRMESNGEIGKVNISQATYESLQDDPQFVVESRGKIQAKGKGEIEMYFVSRNKE